jgi:hypothetical protein
MSHETIKVPTVNEAAALLDLAMSETQSPVGELGDALARMSRALSGACTLVEGKRNGRVDAEMLAHIERCRELFVREVAVCIESLQFHDRLIQQLTHAKNCLAAQGANSSLPAAQRAVDAWMTRHAAEGSIELF